MKNEKQKVGRKGEDEACLYLIGLGQTILDRNWRTGHLEIDIVTLAKDGVHFVEVKSRTAPVLAPPELNVNKTKQRRIISASLAYMRKRDKSKIGDMEMFFDILTVVFYPGETKIEYYPKAYIPFYVI